MSRSSRILTVSFGVLVLVLVVVGGGVLGFVVGSGFVVGVLVVVGGVGVAVLAVFALFAVGSGVQRLREWRGPTRFSTVPVPRSLRWVRGLLPGDEGTAWWDEVLSCLAETTDEGERRRYVRSYRRNVPQLIWTSWTEHLRASRQRELL